MTVPRTFAASKAGRPSASAATPRQVQAPKLFYLVAERLRSQIGKGQLATGDSLPPEAQLLNQFGVSRPTLREALRVLESEGLIRLGRGARSGAVVLGASIEAVARSGGLYLMTHGTRLEEIHQVRMLIEPSLAAFLAQRCRKEDIRALHACIRSQQASLEARDYQTTISLVVDFHGIMGRASHNSALGLLAGMLNDVAVKVYPKMLDTGSGAQQKAVQRRTKESADAHARLVALIAAKKSTDAENFWRNYMQETATWLMRTGLGKLRYQL